MTASKLALCNKRLVKLAHGFTPSTLGSISSTFYVSYARRSQKRKKIVKLSIFFTLSGLKSVKAARKTLVKLTPAAYKARFIHPCAIMCQEGRFYVRDLFINHTCNLYFNFVYVKRFNLTSK
jgi:hypothetical protein